jgi:RNA polymerase sigma-70 factor (ECF subfamily)
MTDDDTNRFRQMILPHLDAAYNLARWLLVSPEDAEDAVQDSLLKAFKYVNSCRPETARNWILGIVRNSSFDILATRKAKGMQGFADLNADDEDGTIFQSDLFSSPSESPETILLVKDQKAWVHAMIADLKPAFREVVVLRELEELTYQEIAEITRLPLGTVMSRLSRAREQMLQHWKRHHDPS